MKPPPWPERSGRQPHARPPCRGRRDREPTLASPCATRRLGALPQAARPPPPGRTNGADIARRTRGGPRAFEPLVQWHLSRALPYAEKRDALPREGSSVPPRTMRRTRLERGAKPRPRSTGETEDQPSLPPAALATARRRSREWCECAPLPSVRGRRGSVRDDPRSRRRVPLRGLLANATSAHQPPCR